jgi:hypothetical protein
LKYYSTDSTNLVDLTQHLTALNDSTVLGATAAAKNLLDLFPQPDRISDIVTIILTAVSVNYDDFFC